MKQLTIDVGGTFTDCLVLEDGGQLQRFKASTTPDDPTRGFFAAALKAAAHYGQTLDKFLGDVEQIIHGTTLGTNILITERGAKVGMITTKGFRDSIEMRRGIRNLHGSMFDMFIEPYKPLVPRDLSPRRGGAHALRRQGAHAVERERAAERGAETAGRRLHRDRHLLPALLCQRRERAQGESAWCRRWLPIFTSRPRTRSCRSGASSSASPPPWSAPISARR